MLKTNDNRTREQAPPAWKRLEKDVRWAARATVGYALMDGKRDLELSTALDSRPHSLRTLDDERNGASMLVGIHTDRRRDFIETLGLALHKAGIVGEAEFLDARAAIHGDNPTLGLRLFDLTPLIGRNSANGIELVVCDLPDGTPLDASAYTPQNQPKPLGITRQHYEDIAKEPNFGGELAKMMHGAITRVCAEVEDRLFNEDISVR